MLSKTDLQWLEGRKVMCPRCDHYRAHIEGTGTCHRGEKAGWLQVECRWFQRTDLVPDYKDAAEFEAMCARLAEFGTFLLWREVFGPKKGVCELCREFGLSKEGEDGECVREDAECRLMWCRILTEMEL